MNPKPIALMPNPSLYRVVLHAILVNIVRSATRYTARGPRAAPVGA
jgi:hypothetical protein